MKKHEKIIALDFDGCIVTNKYPEIGEPIEKNINKLKEEQKAGAKVILWTNRRDDYLKQDVNFCNDHGIRLDAVNANLPEIIEAFGGDTRKIFANEYWDDKAVLMSEQDIGEFSDGYHTFNSLYHQCLILFATLVGAFPNLAWKSHKHSDGEVPFGGGWFVVGIATPEGQYTYHYEDKDWDLFQCPEVETAPKWDGHTDKDITRLLSLFKPESGTQSDWATREIALAAAAEKKMADGTNDWAYGVACYESALRAHQSLSRDGHSGYSIQITKGILNRLIDGKCLTPIEDTPNIWSDISEVFSKGDKRKYYQCKRMSSLFKEVAEDGTVTLSDTNRVYCVNVENPDATFTNSFATRLVDKIFPIAMPYFPASKKFKVVQDEFLVDSKNGDYDTVGYICIMTPDGKKVELNRYFKEVDRKMVQVEKAEFDERKAKRVDKKKGL